MAYLEICARKKLVKEPVPGMGLLYSRNLCQKEVSQVQQTMGRMLSRRSSNSSSRREYGSEDQALIVHSKKGRRNSHHSKGKNIFPKDNSRKDLSKLRCYTCDERGHFAKDCPTNKVNCHNKKGNKRIHHAHAAEDDEPSTMKVKILQVMKNMF